MNAIAPRARTRMTTSTLGPLEPEPGAFDSWAPENVAPVVVWLASDATAGVERQIFVVWGAPCISSAPYAPVASLRASSTWTVADLIAHQDELFAGRSTGIPAFPFGA